MSNEGQLANRSTRELQSYGAACLAAWCSASGIRSKHVTALVEHLLLLLTADDLPAWEAAGTQLALAGRGDPMPHELHESLRPNVAADLYRLVDCAVEIGIVDMYGATTDQPAKFARNCLALLADAGVSPPPPRELFESPSTAPADGWGPPAPRSVYERARTWCLRTLGQ